MSYRDPPWQKILLGSIPSHSRVFVPEHAPKVTRASNSHKQNAWANSATMEKERPEALIQPELRSDRLKFRRLDQPRVGHGDRMQQTIEFARPEIQELHQFRKMGMQVVLLPDVVLQDPGMVRHMVEDVGGGEAVAF